MSTLARNLRSALRTLIHSPAFGVVVILVLALGIGANTAIFSVVYAALLRPLPFHDPDRLVLLGETRDQDATPVATQASYPDFLDWKRRAKSYQSIAGFSGDGFTLVTTGEPKSTPAAQVTPNFFSALGVKPILGRDFVDGEDVADGPHVAIISYKFWKTEFGGDSQIVGRIIHLDRKATTVIGVLPNGFEFAPANPAPIWVPFHQSGDPITRRSLYWFSVIGRLAPGVSPTQARAEMDGIIAQLKQEFPQEDGGMHFLTFSLREVILGQVQPLLLILLGAVGFVLLITCANVANLFLTRAVGRRKEFAVRTALGASRTDLAGQLLTESFVLATLGAVFGLIAASWGTNLLIALIPDSLLQTMPFLRDAGINLPVVAFLCGITVVTALLFGLAPAWMSSRADFNEILKEESRGGTSSGHNRVRQTLVVAEIAITLVLLVATGLMVRSLSALLHQDTGLDIGHVFTFSVNLPDDAYPSDKTYPFDSPSARRFEHEFTDRLRNLPGVINAAAAAGLPIGGGNSTIRFVIEGRPTQAGEDFEANVATVTTGYFSTLRISLVSGRLFSAQDGPDALHVAVVNKAFAKKYFGNDDAIGKRVRFTFNVKEPFRQIVGVVGDTAQNDIAVAPPAMVYVPNDQGATTFLSYMVRTAGDPAAFVGTARETLRSMDAQLPLIQPQPLQDFTSQSPSVFLRRYPSYLIGSFAGLALILAMVGLYGMISYVVLQRTREIGIRMALGAQRSDILRIVLRQGVVSAVAGVIVGVGASLAVTRLLSSLLFGVAASDGLSFVGAAVLLLIVAFAACTIPATRAMRVDPMVALRYE